MATKARKESISEVKSPEQHEEEIRLMAYYLWIEKGSTDGSDIDDWIVSEKYLTI
ncbi:MAG: DUF2934 domain-containing protein [Chlorobium sp.]|jgi:hypothetical protein|nr:DUF2934 domain-containing protein [Chlorobium sp.]